MVKTHKYTYNGHVEFVTQEQADNIRRVFPQCNLEKLPSVATPKEALGENDNVPKTQTNKHK